MQCWNLSRQRGGKQFGCLSVCLALCSAVQPQNQPRTPTISLLKNRRLMYRQMHSRNLQFQNCSELETLLYRGFLAEVDC